MSTTFTKPTSIINSQFKIDQNHNRRHGSFPAINLRQRRIFLASISVALGLGLNNNGKGLESMAAAEKWGTRSLIIEKFFQPGLSPEDAASRIRQTCEGLHSLREMLDNMSWRYVLFYIRLKQSYLSQDMTSALQLVPQTQKKSYVSAANELVDNMTEVWNLCLFSFLGKIY